MATTREGIAARVRGGLERLQMTQQDLARLVELDPTALSRALNGQRDFKSVEIARIASALELPVGFLLGDDVADPNAALKVAARLQSGEGVDLGAVLKRINTAVAVDQMLTSCNLPAASQPALTVPKSTAPWQEGAKLTEVFRSLVSVDDHYRPPIDFTDFALWIENTMGVDVIYGTVPNGVDGISVAHGSFKLLVINSETPATRRRWTIAHELGHLVAGDTQDLRIDYNIYRRSPEEQRANSFAANLLLPEIGLRQSWEEGRKDEDHIAALLDEYGVSLEALAYRLHNIQCVNAAGRDTIRSMAVIPRATSALAHSSLGERRYPMNLLRRAFTAYHAGEISVAPIADILDWTPDEVLSAFEAPADETVAMSDSGAASSAA